MSEQLLLFEMPKITAEQMFEAYYSCRKHKRNTEQALEFEVNLEQNLFELLDEINSRTYEVGRSTVFVIDKPVKREVFAASFRDRIVHHLLINMINPVLDRSFIFDSYSCRVGKGSFLGINRLRHFMSSVSDNYKKEAWILKLDIKGFFMSIDRKLLYSRLREFLVEHYYDENLEIALFLCKKIIFNDPTNHCLYRCSKKKWKDLPSNKSLFRAENDKGLPIGNLTSQVFANFYMSPLDHFVKHNLEIKCYGRYVDDFFLVHQSRDYLLYCKNRIEEFVTKELHIDINQKKTYFQPVSHGASFLGVNIQPGHINMSKRMIRNFSNSVFDFNKTAEKRKLRRNEMLSLRNSFNSYLGICSHYNTYRLKKKILLKLDKRILRRIEIKKDFSAIRL